MQHNSTAGLIAIGANNEQNYHLTLSYLEQIVLRSAYSYLKQFLAIIRKSASLVFTSNGFNEVQSLTHSLLGK